MSITARNRQITIYGIALAALIILLKWAELRYILVDRQLETYAGIIAVIFTLLGVWLALKLRKPKVETLIVERQIFAPDGSAFVLNERELKRINMSKRELEVLKLMAEGLSNREIAESLFVSLNTIKTHTAQIFEKLEVKRRTQAVDMGKKLSLIP
ncbi:response regulator transcription factor [Mucilaginibacter xinganensis]|uniref:Helix-turn-helix transcriptional regulator n=1 Tax=Mucilaginibacter xinganensis TaxID=1234841 RepID=A0A223NTP5_9SPHI|nr:LuxR C-terminal-related transcriptional regulator [Mucilaginibacter xinganensis]ASU33265.1 helix-turn-helix transcriptional regulator [Mucilaginibacter xinganensis]